MEVEGDEDKHAPSSLSSSTMAKITLQTYENGILAPEQSMPPSNIEDIRKWHTTSRAISSPTKSFHEKYIYDISGTLNESTLICEMLPLLAKHENLGYRRAFNKRLTNFPKDAGFNIGLTALQPGFIEGLDIHQFQPFSVGRLVHGSVLYKDNIHSVTLPHLAGEWKAYGKDLDFARVQSAYVGAALVYARNQALAVLGRPDPPGHAEVTTFTTNGITVKFFAHHAAVSQHGILQYHQHLYASANMENYQGFEDAVRGLRNQQDHAKQASYALKDQLISHWNHLHTAGLLPLTTGVPLSAPVLGSPDSTADTDQDEDEE